MSRKERQARREASKDWRGYYDEIKNESPRAQVILGAAFVEEHLGSLLEAFLIKDSKAVERLFEYNGPLGTFGSKTRMAYCLGLISEIEEADLNTLREIRNKFAHQLQGLSFKNQGIKSKCMGLKVVPTNKDYGSGLDIDDPLTRFKLSVSWLSVNFKLRCDDVREHRCNRLPSFPITPFW